MVHHAGNDERRYSVEHADPVQNAALLIAAKPIRQDEKDDRHYRDLAQSAAENIERPLERHIQNVSKIRLMIRRKLHDQSNPLFLRGKRIAKHLINCPHHQKHKRFNQIYTDSWTKGDGSIFSDQMLILNFCLADRCDVFLDQNKYAIVSKHQVCASTILPTEDFYYPGRLYEGVQIYIDLAAIHRPGRNRFFNTARRARGGFSYTVLSGQRALFPPHERLCPGTCK